jgi:hypothetical protein
MLGGITSGREGESAKPPEQTLAEIQAVGGWMDPSPPTAVIPLPSNIKK